MKGVVVSRGYVVSEKRIAIALHKVAPEAYEARRHDTLDRLNPVPYVARYFGHKLHVDQNE